MNITPFDPADVHSLRDALDTLVTTGGSPGGVLVCGTADGERHTIGAGVVAPECGDTPPTSDTVYDAASLTKVIATWPLIGRAAEAGLIELDAPVREFLPPFTSVTSGEAPGGGATLRQLLAHTSGLRAETRLDRYRGNPLSLAELLCREPLEEPPGRHRYLNRGFILLGLALAHVHGRPLHELAADLWADANMTATTYGPIARAVHVAPTEQRLTAAPRIWGAVHDDNAALMGGVAGHAGVFTTTGDLATYAEHLLDPADPLGLAAWFEAGRTPQVSIEPGIDRGLAWLLADDAQAVYHHGWTGTSLFLAPATGRYLAICTNAVYHGRPSTRVAPLRALARKALIA
ncbi:serine hydrolase domain-containing protein [Streptomyces sp. SID3343]|uniref:serine hydrolase domain-containing protein n=1 Tax=Streptomyces sp. SID3343 TaxID=2690260 RepID=UPI00136BEBC7|nr:serine hydrolase domain-containing protein [Streptomyces sp. SID3343]MYV97041.1 serine hydrolase [Streptomyces sp. SID3343]